MVKTRMQGTRIYQVGETYLFDAAQALKIGMFDQLKQGSGGDTDKTINRIIHDFLPTAGT